MSCLRASKLAYKSLRFKNLAIIQRVRGTEGGQARSTFKKPLGQISDLVFPPTTMGGGLPPRSQMVAAVR